MLNDQVQSLEKTRIGSETIGFTVSKNQVSALNEEN